MYILETYCAVQLQLPSLSLSSHYHQDLYPNTPSNMHVANLHLPLYIPSSEPIGRRSKYFKRSGHNSSNSSRSHRKTLMMKQSTTARIILDSTTLMLLSVSLGMAAYSFIMHHRRFMVDEILDSHHEEAIDFGYLEAFIQQLQDLLKQR